MNVSRPGSSAPVSLYVRVVSARKLKSADSNGLSDPYCKLSLKKERFKTKVKKETLNPKWNESFKFEQVDPSDILTVTVLDWDRIGFNDDFLGRVTIPISTILPLDKTRDEWMPLKGTTDKDNITGDIHLLFHLTSSGQKPMLTPSVQDGKGKCTVEVVAGRDLAIKDKRTASSDPYCVIILGDEKYKTSIIERDINPVWEEEEFFFEVEKDNDELVVQCFDWNLLGVDDFLGQVVLPISMFADSKTHDNWHKLVPRKKETVSGELRIRVQYLSAIQAQKNYVLAQRNYEHLIKILTAPDLVIMSSLLYAYESHELTRSAVNLFTLEGHIFFLLNQLIYRDLKKTVQEGTLFRTDSPATRCITSYLKFQASGYLHEIMTPLLRAIHMSEGIEVDPEKCKGDVKENLDRLRATTQNFFDAIVASWPRSPIKIRQMFSHLRKLVSQKYPDSQLKCVGGFIFLRIIGPSLIAPEGFGLLKAPPSPSVRRTLCLIAKVLQNIANGVYFKEEYMQSLNDMIDANKPRCLEYYDNLSTVPPDSSAVKVFQGSSYTEEAEKIKELSLIIGHIGNNMVKMDKEFANDLRIANNAAKLEKNKHWMEELKHYISL